MFLSQVASMRVKPRLTTRGENPAYEVEDSDAEDGEEPASSGVQETSGVREAEEDATFEQLAEAAKAKVVKADGTNPVADAAEVLRQNDDAELLDAYNAAKLERNEFFTPVTSMTRFVGAWRTKVPLSFTPYLGMEG